MEPPECPVCLQPYEFTGGAVPRVLPCGHSACESCLSLLPRRPAAPSTVRCPACNLLVRLPYLGPSALPKNIDLLRIFYPNSHSSDLTPTSNPNTNPKPNSYPLLLRLPWTQDLYLKWKDLVLPYDSISLFSFDAGVGTSTASLSSSSRKNRKVSLLPVATSTSSIAKPGLLRPSYMARVMDSLQRMGEEWRSQLWFLVDASSRQRLRISRVLGLWMGPEEESSPLFIVFENFNKGVLDVLIEGRRMDEMVPFAMMVMEMCEAVMGLHSECIVCGCLLPDCFVFDEYGHCILDLSRVLISGRRIRGEISGASISDSAVFASPEVCFSLQGSIGASNGGFGGSVGFGSDVWSLACVIAMILLCDAMLGKEQFQGFHGIFSRIRGAVVANVPELLLDHYDVWKEKVASKLETLHLETGLDSLFPFLKASLSYQPQSRPQVKELWCCIRSFLTKTQVASFAGMDASDVKENFVICLINRDMCSVPHKANYASTTRINGFSVDDSNVDPVGSSRDTSESSMKDKVDVDHIERSDGDGFKSVILEGHHDCITALAVGGGYLFSASFDKTVKMWSLQDFSLVQTFRGHEHKIMAMVVVDGVKPLCISGDSRSGIFIWHIGTSASQELLKHWYEHNDWRYSGVHSLAVSGTSHLLYSGGGDKSVKAWSLQDYSLSCVMTGHKSTVSTLAVSDGVLYSGSWDGTIRLWSLYDHSLLSELVDDAPSSPYPVLSLTVDRHLVFSSYENGCIKVWSNDMFVTSMQIHKGAIFALHVGSNWICTGGWDMVVSIQELLEEELQVNIRPVASLSCDSVITSLLQWHGKLFVALSNKIKVFNAAEVPIEWEEHYVGDTVDPRTQSFLTWESLESVRRNGVGLKGPMATPIGKGHRSLNLTLRKELGLYANVRPCFSLPGYKTRYDDVDLVTIRENTEGEYSGLEHQVVRGVVESLKIITRQASLRVAEYAFHYAQNNGRKRVSAIHKANIMRKTDGLFLKCCREVAKKHPNITYEEVVIDNCCMMLVKNPTLFDVLVMPNLYGDIISDLCAGLIGGLGLTPSCNIGEGGIALAEAVHGSAPDIAGKNLANPTALLLSAVAMLRHLKLDDKAERIHESILKTIAKGEYRTVDLGGKASTTDFTKAICDNLG